MLLAALALVAVAGCKDEGNFVGVPVNAAASAAFTDLDLDGGQIEGAPVFTPAADETSVTEYRLYWGQNATTKLAGNSTAIGTVPVGGAASFAAFAANTPLPAGASHFLVFTANADGEMATGVSGPIVDFVVPPKVYVANYASNNVSVIDTATDTVTATVSSVTGPYAVAITPDGNFAYVTNWTSGNVSVIDTASNIVLATITVGGNPYGIAIKP